MMRACCHGDFVKRLFLALYAMVAMLRAVNSRFAEKIIESVHVVVFCYCDYY